MLAFDRLAIATPARPFAVAGSCSTSHSGPSSCCTSSVEARTSWIARMSTSRLSSQAPMPLRYAARMPFVLMVAMRRGLAVRDEGMQPV